MPCYYQYAWHYTSLTHTEGYLETTDSMQILSNTLCEWKRSIKFFSDFNVQIHVIEPVNHNWYHTIFQIP